MSEKQVLNKISEDLIRIEARDATLKVPGVNHLNDSIADNISKIIVGKDTSANGIKISKNKDDMFVIDISIVADYGCNIPQLAFDIQSAVKDKVTKAIKQEIGAVNIHIEGVVLPNKNTIKQEIL